MKKESKSFKKLIRFFWIAFSGFIVLLFLWFILISYGVFGFMPGFDELENPKSSLASEVLSSDQKVLGLFYIKNRTIVEFNDLSPFLVEALIATEDSRFKDHSGIDGRSLARVFFKTFLLGKKSAGGGSTISQQLAKNLFPRDGTNILLAKMKEWVVSVQLEKRYTKDEIITMYFNTVEYGNNAYGIKAAAKTYFNKLPSELKLEEAAVLVGLLKGTTMYNPIRNPENSFNRRNTVLSQMNKYDYLSNAELDSLKEIPLVTDFSPPSHNSGKAQYIREYLRLFLTANEPNEDDYSSDEAYEHAKDEWENNPLYGWCNKNEKPNGENYNLYKDGLKIYTTINSKMQMYAEQAVKNHLSKDLQKAFFKEQKSNKKAPFSSKLSDEQVKKIMDNSIKRSERYWNHKRNGLSHDSIIKIFHTPVKTSVFSWDGPKEMIISPYDSILQTKYYLHAGFISIEPQTGYVRSYVGGINYTYFKFDNVSQGKRQVGSTFKPFIYSLIIEKGYSPCTKVPNIEVSFKLPDGKLYTPGYSKSKYDGKMISLKKGLAYSLNQISAWVLKKFNPQSAVQMAKRMGITSKIEPYPSICVGAAEVSLEEMVAAYCVYANKGVYKKPVLVTRIEDRFGNVLGEFSTQKVKEAISEETAYVMLQMMRGVVDEGTSTRLKWRYGLKNPIAGKTGTTNDNSDGWFIGITPELVSGAWVGGEERSIRFRSTALGQGANMALPIWALYMKDIYKDKSLDYSSGPFEKPDALSIETDCNKYESDNGDKFPIDQ